MNNLLRNLIEIPTLILKFVSSVLESIFVAPVRKLDQMFTGAQSQLRKYDRSNKLVDADESGIVGNPLKNGFWKFLQFLAFPFRLLVFVIKNLRSQAGFCVPAILGVCLVGFVCFRVFLQSDSITSKYRLGALAHIEDGEFHKAKTYCERLVSDHRNVRDFDWLNLVICLNGNGEFQRAAKIVNELAPDDEAGYPNAHRLKALSLARTIEKTKRSDLREKLLWHLEHASNENSVEISLAYALYYLETGQLEKAIAKLESAGQVDPVHYLQLASILKDRGEEIKRIHYLRLAEQGFRKLLERDPADNSARMALALALARQDKNEAAEILLKDGLRISSSPEIKRAVADFYLMRHDQAETFPEQLAWIQKSIDLDPNHVVIYQRLIKQFTAQLGDSPQHAEEIKLTLKGSIAKGHSIDMAHFALSNLLWLEGDTEQANWHIKKAYELNPGFVLIANNLAWVLAHQEEPELDRALGIMREVFERTPNDPRIRDTLGTILFLKRQWDESLTHLEFALSRMPVEQKPPIHKKLAIVYENLGEHDMAKLHQDELRQFERGN